MIRAPGLRQSSPLCSSHLKQEGQCKEVQAATVPGQQTGSVAVMSFSPCCPPEHSDLLLPVLQFMEAQMCWPSGGSTQQMQQASALPPIAHPGSGPCPEWWILD